VPKEYVQAAPLAAFKHFTQKVEMELGGLACTLLNKENLILGTLH